MQRQEVPAAESVRQRQAGGEEGSVGVCVCAVAGGLDPAVQVTFMTGPTTDTSAVVLQKALPPASPERGQCTVARGSKRRVRAFCRFTSLLSAVLPSISP